MSINFTSQLSLLDIHSRKNCINLYGKFETDGNHRVEGIEKMKVAKLFSGIADILIAYCVGHCSLLGTAPFGTAIIGAGSACGRSPWMLLLGLLGAFFEQGGFEKQGQMIYPLIWVMAAVLVRVRKLQLLYPRSFLLSVLVGLETIVLQIGAAFWLPGAIGIPLACAEGALVFSFMLAYCFSYRNLSGDKLLFLTDTQTMLAVLILATTVLAGMPVQLGGVVEVLASVCLFTIFYISYRFGFSAGVSWAAISGAIYALRTDDMQMLAAWVFLAVLVNGLTEFLHIGRYGSILIFVASDCLLGYFAFPQMLSEAGIKAIATAVFVLFFLPGRLFVQVRTQGDAMALSGAEWGKLTLSRVRSFSDALKRIDYTFAGTEGQRIGFSQIGTMLEDFTKQLDSPVAMRKDAETAIVSELGRMGVHVKSLTLLKAQNGRYQLYADARVGRGRLVGAEAVRKIASKETGIPFEIGEDSRQMVGRSYDLVILNQKPAFRIQTAARRLSCQEDVISGDNFYIGNLKNGQALLMIADGMGNGVQAAKDSEALLSAVEELVMTGFEQEMAVRLVNAYLAEKNKGEHFTTLDMLLLDLYTGVGHLVKYGAATTYVCRGNWMECIKSTSLPVGVMEDAGCECSSKKYYAGDLIVMVSDGVLDSILFENKDDYMHTLLEALKDEEPETVVEAVIQDIRSVCGKRLKDDATIIVCKVMKNL